jgi:hypothetical protein
MASGTFARTSAINWELTYPAHHRLEAGNQEKPRMSPFAGLLRFSLGILGVIETKGWREKCSAQSYLKG